MKKQYEVIYTTANGSEWKSKVIEAKTVNEAIKAITSSIKDIKIEMVNYLGFQYKNYIY